LLTALAISLVSLAFSMYLGLRDRCRLVIESQFFPEDEYGPACVQTKIVNAGRRVNANSDAPRCQASLAGRAIAELQNVEVRTLRQYSD